MAFTFVMLLTILHFIAKCHLARECLTSSGNWVPVGCHLCLRSRMHRTYQVYKPDGNWNSNGECGGGTRWVLWQCAQTEPCNITCFTQGSKCFESQVESFRTIAIFACKRVCRKIGAIVSQLAFGLSIIV